MKTLTAQQQEILDVLETGPHAPFDAKAHALARASRLPMDDPRVQAAKSFPDRLAPYVFIVCTSHRQRSEIDYAMRMVTGERPVAYYTMRRGGTLLAVPASLADVFRHGPSTTRWRQQAGEGEPRRCIGQ